MSTGTGREAPSLVLYAARGSPSGAVGNGLYRLHGQALYNAPGGFTGPIPWERLRAGCSLRLPILLATLQYLLTS